MMILPSSSLGHHCQEIDFQGSSLVVKSLVMKTQVMKSLVMKTQVMKSLVVKTQVMMTQSCQVDQMKMSQAYRNQVHCHLHLKIRLILHSHCHCHSLSRQSPE